MIIYPIPYKEYKDLSNRSKIRLRTQQRNLDNDLYNFIEGYEFEYIKIQEIDNLELIQLRMTLDRILTERVSGYIE